MCIAGACHTICKRCFLRRGANPPDQHGMQQFDPNYQRVPSDGGGSVSRMQSEDMMRFFFGSEEDTAASQANHFAPQSGPLLLDLVEPHPA